MNGNILRKILENKNFRCSGTYRGRDLGDNLSFSYLENESLVLVSKLTIDENDGDWQRLDFEFWGCSREVDYSFLTSREPERFEGDCVALSKKVLEDKTGTVMIVPCYDQDHFVYDIYS